MTWHRNKLSKIYENFWTSIREPMILFDVARVFLPNCRSLSKQDDSTSLGMRWGWIPRSTLTELSEYQFVDCREIGSVPLVAHDTPGFVRWKQTCCLSTLAWMLHGDLLRIEHAGGTSWTLLRSNQGHAPDDDDDSWTGYASESTVKCLPRITTWYIIHAKSAKKSEDVCTVRHNTQATQYTKFTFRTLPLTEQLRLRLPHAQLLRLNHSLTNAQ